LGKKKEGKFSGTHFPGRVGEGGKKNRMGASMEVGTSKEDLREGDKLLKLENRRKIKKQGTWEQRTTLCPGESKEGVISKGRRKNTEGRGRFREATEDAPKWTVVRKGGGVSSGQGGGKEEG